MRIVCSCVGDAAMASVRHGLDVFEEGALADLQRVRDPCRATLRQLGLRDLEFESIVDSVHRDDIAVLDQRDRPADLCLGHNMANAEPVAPVGKHTNISRELPSPLEKSTQLTLR